MAINWQEIITTLGGDAVLLLAAAWLIKQLISNRLLRETEESKTKLKFETDTQIERLRSSLQMSALEPVARTAAFAVRVP